MKKNTSPHSDNIRVPLTVCIMIGIFLLAVYTVLASATELPHLPLGIALTVVYIGVTALVLWRVKVRLAEARAERERDEAFNTETYRMFRESVDLPYAVISADGSVALVNKCLGDLLGHTVGSNSNIRDICSADAEQIIKASREGIVEAQKTGEQSRLSLGEGLDVTVSRRNFVAKAYPMTLHGHSSYMVVFTETTELCALRDKMFRENAVVALIVIDNLEELAQYVRVSYRSAANEIETILKNWSNSMDGILREYDRDKYLLIISREHLEECVKNKFEILDTVRDVRLGDDSMSVTVSMGISASEGSFAEREAEASSALELALGRGGDQVALRRGHDTEYFGGRSKSIQKRTRVRSRVNANVLCSKIAESSNVLVMGHKSPDFDCIGASVGIARLAMFCGVPVKIISDLKSSNVHIVSSRFEKYDEYKDMFVDAAEGLDLVSPDTLLVICDANNFGIIEAPEIADNVDRIAIIDHHRQTGEFDFEPLVNYIDPAASSACELIAEILEQSVPSGKMLREEATAMLAGIMLDTKFFAKSTGSRTFSAALYLQSEGGRAELARKFFDEDIDEFLAEAKFSRNIEIYRSNIAITRSEGTGNDELDRRSASKAADKLLAVRQVEASFALVRSGNFIRISGRSSGKINVQLILEKLKGGGHFDSAGAVVEGVMNRAYQLLTDAIDSYLAEK